MTIEPVRLGIIGLGLAGSLMIDAARRHPGVSLVAAADPHEAPRAAFATDFDAQVYSDAADLLADPRVEVVYIATPHHLHAPQAIAAARHGKHVIVEKPLALSLADCDAIVAEVERNGVYSIVGHTHGFDPSVRMMREEVASGRHGRLALLALSNYTDFLYRPRRPEDLDTARGGGIIYNQLPHQIDIARLVANSAVTHVRAAVAVLDEARPTEGLVNAFLQFSNGASASIVYSGYDYFDSDELHDQVGELGALTPLGRQGAARRRLAAMVGDEGRERSQTLSYGSVRFPEAAHQPHFGLVTATCAGGDIRLARDGLTIFDAQGRHDRPVPPGQGRSGHRILLDDVIGALRRGVEPLQNAAWGRATVAIALAMLQSARNDREIAFPGPGREEFASQCATTADPLADRI